MRQVKWLGLMLMCVVFMFGCLPKNIQTESGKQMDQKMINVYAFLDYSEMLSDKAGKLTSDLYDRGYIDDKEKNEIGEIWKEHKSYHQLLQEEYSRIYEKIDNGEKIDSYNELYRLVKKVMKETNSLSKIMTELFGDIYVPDTLIGRMFELYEIITEERVEE